MSKKNKLFLLICLILLLFMIRTEGVVMVDKGITENDLKYAIVYDNIPLTVDEQYFIYNESIKRNMSFELILSMIKLESNFEKNLVSKTNDYGIMQIHKKYADWYAELGGLENYNIFSFEDNVIMGISGIAFYCDFYRDKKMSEELVFYYGLNSYNMGIGGYKRYVSNNSNISRAYDRRILDYKIELERNN